MILNTKTTGIMGITIAIIIGIGIIYAVSNSLVNTNESNVKIESSTIVNPESFSNPIISDDVIINSENQNYTVNEDGKRHYTLIAKTEPVVSP